MSNAEFMSRLLEPYGPQGPLDQLIERINKLYHAAEAKDYDEKHVEISGQLPSLWREMAGVARERCGASDFRILDFGCGTGFEAEQLLQELPRERISALTCYDHSPDMLQRCQAKLHPRCPEAIFCDDLERLPVNSALYNLLATNSLLHHLPDPMETIRKLGSFLTPGAVWIAGHEPSCRFYRRAECVEALERFERKRKWGKFLRPENYLKRLKAKLGLQSSPADEAARESVAHGCFSTRPPARVVALLVDYHVAHSREEMAAGRGLDFETMRESLQGAWSLVWRKTYSYMGAFYEGGLSHKWGRVCRELAERFPDDGANFCTVWVRV